MDNRKGIGVVKTTEGLVLGEALTGEYEGITTFRSVPYAAPPVGKLRFMPPQDHASWQGVRDTRHFAGMPCQLMRSGPGFEPWETDFYFDGMPPMTEDCLYLHITTGAASSAERRPVFMWFHGGGLGTGFYSEHEFDPRTLAKKGIVVVSVGQRLNVFGYLALPQFQAAQGRTGNYGLLDEVKALDWVRENIAAFGGDPDNITVGGQSGGTWKSNALAISPLSQGKIRRVINQSNLNWATWEYFTQEEYGETGREYLRHVGIDPDLSLEELQKLPAEAFYAIRPGDDVRRVMPGRMVCDGYAIMYESPTENMAHYGMKLDYLSGGNLGEAALFELMQPETEVFPDAAHFYDYMKAQLGDLYDDAAFRQMWPVTDENAAYRSRELAARGLSGGVLGGGVIVNRHFGAYRKAMGSEARTFAYNFTHFTPCLPEEKGTVRDTDRLLAWHSSELWYTFASLRKGMPPARPWTDYDLKLADIMSSYWANFITSGDPNGEGLPQWPQCGDYAYLELGDGITVHEGLDAVDKLALAYLRKTGKYPEF